MAVLKREEYFAKLQGILANNNSDEAISTLEDMTDTYNDLETRANGTSDSEWQRKYQELDEMWKKRYTHRFFNGDNKGIPESVTEVNETEEYSPDEITVETLFEKKEDK